MRPLEGKRVPCSPGSLLLPLFLPWAWLGPQGALASTCPSESSQPGEEERT